MIPFIILLKRFHFFLSLLVAARMHGFYRLHFTFTLIPFHRVPNVWISDLRLGTNPLAAAAVGWFLSCLVVVFPDLFRKETVPSDVVYCHQPHISTC